MTQLMRFYLGHTNWRARLAMNRSASWIFTCWLYAGFSAFAAIGGYVAKTTSVLQSLGILALSLFLVIFSYTFLAEAKRIRHIRILAKNALFIDEI